jgi:hypothetical protein
VLGDTLAVTLTTCLIYKISWNRLRLVGFIDNSRSRGNWPIPRLESWCHRLLGIYYATHLVPKLGSGNLGLFWRSYLLNHFFREFFSKKEVFQFTEPICPLHHQIITVIYCMPRFFRILYSKPWRFGFKARGLRDTCHQ